MASSSPTRCRYPGARPTNQRKNPSATLKLSGIQYTGTTTADRPQSLNGPGEGRRRPRTWRFGSLFPLPRHGSDLPNGGSVKTHSEQKMRKGKKTEPEE